MYSLSEKLVAVIVALLLGLTPLQGAMAAAAATPAQGMAMHQMVDSQGDEMTTPANQLNHDCEQSISDNCCTGHACSSSQCASCVPGLLSAISPTIDPALAFGLLPTNEGFISRFSSSPFRPPRA